MRSGDGTTGGSSSFLYKPNAFFLARGQEIGVWTVDTFSTTEGFTCFYRRFLYEMYYPSYFDTLLSLSGEIGVHRE